ncbi:MAG TPA: hypothetical protein VHO67_14965 [Polyangia bacterium]|nr:hypothetical protein [Polyangia bacterium]
MNRRSLLTTLLSTTAVLAAASCAAAPLPPRSQLRDRAAGYEMTVLVDGVPARTFERDGETYVLGTLGARYTLRIANHSSRRVEAVVSVDGRDAVNGRPGDFRTNRGYLIPAWGSVDIDGWRISQSEAAAFRFSSVPHSYAARMGSAREVGVIGVAMFPERYVPPVYVPRSVPYAAPRALGEHKELDAPSESGGQLRSAPAPSAKAEEQASRGAESGDILEPPLRRSRPGLGTEYGEAVSSPITEVEFVRANPVRPSVVLGVRYNDRAGLLAMGIAVDGDTCAADANLRLSAEPFPAADRRYAPPPAGWRRACSWR